VILCFIEFVSSAVVMTEKRYRQVLPQGGHGVSVLQSRVEARSEVHG
jgi:hypothetical protein